MEWDENNVQNCVNIKLRNADKQEVMFYQTAKIWRVLHWNRDSDRTKALNKRAILETEDISVLIKWLKWHGYSPC